MIIFILGFIVGLIVAFIIVVMAMFFRHPIEKLTTIVEKQLGNAGPRPRGKIIEPPSDAEEARQRIIDRNAEQGRDTHISELM